MDLPYKIEYGNDLEKCSKCLSNIATGTLQLAVMTQVCAFQ